MCATRSGLPSAEWPVLQRCAGSVAWASPRSSNQSRVTPATSSGRPAIRGGAGRAPARVRAPPGLHGRAPESAAGVRSGWAQARQGRASRPACGAKSAGREHACATEPASRSARTSCAIGLGAGGRGPQSGASDRRGEGHPARARRQGSPSDRYRSADGSRGPAAPAGASPAPLSSVVGRDVQGVREALQLVGGEAPAPGLDAADGGLVDAHPLGQGALAPALLLAQLRDQRCRCSRDVLRASFPSPPPVHFCITVRHCMPAFLHRCTLDGLACDVIIAS